MSLILASVNYMQSDFQKNLKRLHRFLSREDERGYGFCIAQNQKDILWIEKELKERLGGRLASVHLEIGEIGIVEQIRQVGGKDKTPLFIRNLDQVLRDTASDHLLELNFSREALHDLGIPMIFWVSESNFSLIANRAADLFTQRQLGSLFFAAMNQSWEMPMQQELEVSEGAKSMLPDSEEEDKLLRIDLLKKQLAEAEANGLKPAQIAEEHALPLVQAYADMHRLSESREILKQWHSHLKKQDEKQLVELGDASYAQQAYEEARTYYSQALKIYQLKNKQKRTLYLYQQLGNIESTVGNLEEALTLYEKFEEVASSLYAENLEDTFIKNVLAISYEKLGSTHSSLGHLDEAFKYFGERYRLGKELYEAY
ncbi:MAG: tetratricopeptide repeat protein, partial [Bacteroidota bacterium]